MIKLLKKIQEVKSEIGKISKDKTNPFHKSKYFDINILLDHLEPLLQKQKLLLLQPIDGGTITSCIYDLEHDETDETEPDVLCSSMTLPEISDAQKMGSAITYYRRYTLVSLLSLQAEDDDGNKASNLTNQETTNGEKKDFNNSKQVDKWIKEGDKLWNRALDKDMSLADLRTYVKVSKENAEKYLQALNTKLEKSETK